MQDYARSIAKRAMAEDGGSLSAFIDNATDEITYKFDRVRVFCDENGALPDIESYRDNPVFKQIVDDAYKTINDSTDFVVSSLDAMDEKLFSFGMKSDEALYVAQFLSGARIYFENIREYKDGDVIGSIAKDANLTKASYDEEGKLELAKVSLGDEFSEGLRKRTNIVHSFDLLEKTGLDLLAGLVKKKQIADYASALAQIENPHWSDDFRKDTLRGVVDKQGRSAAMLYGGDNNEEHDRPDI